MKKKAIIHVEENFFSAESQTHELLQIYKILICTNTIHKLGKVSPTIGILKIKNYLKCWKENIKKLLKGKNL